MWQCSEIIWLFLAAHMRPAPGLRVVTALAALASSQDDWSVPRPRADAAAVPDWRAPGAGRNAPSTPSAHGERNLDEAFRAAVVTGTGCWWEGDRWPAVVECCGCGTCDRAWLATCCAWSGSWAKRCCPCNRDYAPAP